MKKRIFLALLGAAILFDPVLAHPQTTVLTSGENKSFKLWKKGTQEYLDKVDFILADGSGAVSTGSSGEAFDQSAQDIRQGLQRNWDRCSQILKNLEAVSPPEEFKKYHAKLIESFRYSLLAYDKDFSEATRLKYGRLSEISKREALEILRDIYVKHRALGKDVKRLNELLGMQDRVIETYQEKNVLKRAGEKSDI